MFAIIPSLGTQLAPLDVANAAVTSAQGLKAGDTVYLSATGSLPAGFYTLLPANYSLLDGAYLISAVSGFNNIQPNTITSLADGTPVVAGYRSFGNTGLGGASYSGFAVYPGSWGESLAQYQLTLASNYFAASTHRTIDAGQLSIVTGNTLSANGTINSAAVSDGHAATIDISANNLQIVGSIGQGTTDVVQLQDSVLDSWHAGSLLLGGVHQDDGQSINVAADTVSIAGDAHLVADEVIMVARDTVSIEPGGSVQSTSANSNKTVTLPDSSVVTLKGAGADKAALVAVSDINLMQVARDTSTSSNAQGEIQLSAGSILATQGALNIDAPNGGVFKSNVGGINASWTLSSSHLVLGDSTATGQFNVNSAMLNSMQSAAAITLRSSGAIDFGNFADGTPITLGGNTTSLDSISLQAASLNNLSGKNASLNADTVNLNGVSNPASGSSGDAGSGSLSVNANNVNVINQGMAINGFTTVSLRANRQLKVSDNGALSVNGDLNAMVGRITAGSASNGALNVTGSVQLASIASSSTVTPPATELGGALSIHGNNITDNADIVLPSGMVNLDAAGLLTLGNTAVVDVSGVPVLAAGVRADSNGGVIHLQSGGNLSALAGSQLNVSGSDAARAGTVDVQVNGMLDLQSTLSAYSSGNLGGSININAQSIKQFDQLNDAIQHANFTNQQSIHVAQGNMQLATTDKQVTAHDVQWVTDSGQIQVDGVISATSTQDRSSIRLYGADGVNITGQLHADGDLTTGRGGNIELGVSTDVVNHSGAEINIASSVITANGNEQGGLRLRAPIVNGNDVNISALPNDLSSLGQVTVEAVSVMPAVTTVNWNSVNTLASNSFNSLNSNSALQSRLLNNAKVVLSPGVELTSNGDINLGAVDLSKWNINGGNVPVTLTVRAAGNINVNGVISDGFINQGTGSGAYISATDKTPSATLRLIAGSDLNSVDPLAINDGSMSNLVLGNNSIVRTGTGDLSLVAAHDINFNRGASVYTGGNNAADQMLIGTTGTSASFLVNGGNLSIDAGNNVNGFAVTQSVTAWQPRTTATNNAAFSTATIYWGEDLRQFQWNVGTLGGGDVSVTAGHDISTLSIAAADTGIVNKARDAVTNYGGGAIDIHAGNNVNSGMIYAGRESATVIADNAVTNAIWNNSASPVGLFVAMGDAQVNVDARSGVQLAAVVDPTILDFSISANRKAYFYTYGDSSALSITAASGDIITQQLGDTGIQSFFGSGNSDNRKQILPPSVFIAALSGDVDAISKAILFPSDTGNLSIFAMNNINNLKLTMSDAADAALPFPVSPAGSATAGGIDTSVGLNGNIASARHVGDSTPVVITAGQDINTAMLTLPKSVEISAGRDIVNMTLYAQNLNETDVSVITAGRDIYYTGQTGIVSIGGPGRLDMIASRAIDLGVSNGVESTGRLNDPNIPDANGASINMLAGMSTAWDVGNFIDSIVATTDPAVKDSLASQLIQAVQQITGDNNLSLDDAVSTFKSFSADMQRPFVLKAFFEELVASGTEHNADPKKGYTRGYAAIDALFPDSRSDDNPYVGDISMLFSRVYTLFGGNINMIVPGGKLDVGVAARPRDVQDKSPGQLGIVAQQAGDIDIFANGDVSVNSSRIFTLGGGDIAIWSTLGNIDAGRGAKSSLSIPPPAITIDSQGNVTLVLTGAVAGSGIRTIQTNPDTRPGDVILIAPVGTVDAGDAGIGASGNIIVAAAKVQGAENINFCGQASGVPAATSGVGVSLAGASQTGGSNDKNVDKSIDESTRGSKEEKSSIAQAALSWLEVFVTGLGEENCKQDDVECLKRQK
ncbi:MAG: filamentous hemagglutinin family protein [Steroidobacter sp.]